MLKKLKYILRLNRSNVLMESKIVPNRTIKTNKAGIKPVRSMQNQSVPTEEKVPADFKKSVEEWS